MKKIRKTSELMWLLGILFVAFGVSICNKADLGMSMIAAPTFIIHEFVSTYLFTVKVGVIEYTIQGILLIALCLIVRRFKWRYLLTFLIAVIYGYTINLMLFLLRGVSFDTALSRWIMLFVGDILVGFGVACFFKTYLPLQVFELFVTELSDKYNLKINKTKWIFDMTLLFVSVTLALVLFRDVTTFNWSTIYYQSYHNIGLGTIVTTLINAPIIAFSSKLIDKIFETDPLFPKLKKLIKG